MVQATKFLLRWLYLNNLIYEKAEIQSMPYIHPNWQQQDMHQNNDHGINQYDERQQPHDSHHSHHLSDKYSTQDPNHQSNHNIPPSHSQRQQSYINPQPRTPKNIDSENEWKRKALHSIAIYPPGSLRLLVLDSLRLEIVHELARELHKADKIIEKFSALRKDKHGYLDVEHSGDIPTSEDQQIEEDPRLGADKKIVDDFGEATSIGLNNGNTEKTPVSESTEDTPENDESESGGDEAQELLEPQLLAAVALQRETREFLPQLVSAVLHSPAPLTQSTMFTSHLNPLATLRRLLMTRCVRDPNLGIELCWLLEAEVGRAWKSLFEHRQQTGRRLIIVLPADRAAAIQQIGSEKRAAFDLLQDAESATAYGLYGDDHNEEVNQSQNDSGEWEKDFRHSHDNVDTMGLYTTARLPASLSLERCSHFGDTMHFIDLLTKISLDLRRCPIRQRNHYLGERLEELNRRLRRRMISRGNVSLDVEDNRGPHEWPTLGDVSPDSMKYSIHFPLEPTATVWPGRLGDESASQTHAHSPLLELKTEHGVMRVLNIVSSKCRVLASRERCPYLVHCEVLETGLEGRDARLYASAGSKGVGATVQETLGMAYGRKFPTNGRNTGFTPYRIPSELSSFGLIHSKDRYKLSQSHIVEDQINLQSQTNLLPRGGGQEDGHSYSSVNESNHVPPPNDPGYVPSPYDLVREEQLQQLHEHFQATQQHPHYGPSPQYQMPYHSQEK